MTKRGLWCMIGRCPDRGDGLATACFVLGIKDSMGLLESYGAQALFIDEDGVITVTDGLKERFTLTAGGYTLGKDS